jgi:hypothetical protein
MNAKGEIEINSTNCITLQVRLSSSQRCVFLSFYFHTRVISSEGEERGGRALSLLNILQSFHAFAMDEDFQ